MHEHVLAIGALECADGSHHSATGAGAVAGAFRVDVAGVEAIGAVVAVMSTAGQRADEAMAMATGEAIVDRPTPLISMHRAIPAVGTFRRLGAASFARLAQQ